MAKEFYGFFDSTAEDEREYVADEMAAMFRAMGDSHKRGLPVADGRTTGAGSKTADVRNLSGVYRVHFGRSTTGTVGSFTISQMYYDYE